MKPLFSSPSPPGDTPDPSDATPSAPAAGAEPLPTRAETSFTAPGSEPQPAAEPQPAPAPEAQLDPPPAEPVDPRPGFASRGRLRRRLRYLRRTRELALRDLGGLVFDLYKFSRRNDPVVSAKLVALRSLDEEMRTLERLLSDRREVTLLREPGVTACARCGALHGTTDRFCPSCGTQVDGPVAVA